MRNENTDKVISAFDAPLPENAFDYPKGLYEKYPAFKIGDNKINKGYRYLAESIAGKINKGLRVLVIDGYQGVDWKHFINKLTEELKEENIDARTIDFEECLYNEDKINETVKDFLGGDDRIFGKHFPLSVETFFDPVKVLKLRIDASILRAEKSGALTIFYGTGAALLELWDELWYVDLPKDILQERFREGKVKNITGKSVSGFEEFYKRSYFIEWPSLNRLKRNILSSIELFIDYTDVESPLSLAGKELRETLTEIARTPFRVKPWFFPGPWGGQFMKGHMELEKDKPNYAWSFEVIVPENGVIIESSGNKLEFAFDWLMYQNHKDVLGKAADQFKYEWPIRLDYLDTIDGGNLSTQVHPCPNYIKKEFGETYTQDETYYIVNSKPGATVYLGLKESTDVNEFKSALEDSIEKETEVDIGKYVNSEPSKPHDLFLIPNGTVHCSGEGNLVLEISATPYIFTFKIYDYLRRDLEGNLRPINIERGFENIRSERDEKFVKENLLAVPDLIWEGKDWQLYELYNKPFTFYNIYRLEFESEYELNTNGFAYAVNLVEGESIELKSKNGRVERLSYLESMIIPAAAEKVEIKNLSKKKSKLVLVKVKEEVGITEPVNNPND
ncbi:MAG: class I mannose-6-phosphate isomerase [Ignavibacteria bacterium]|jgi:mannose-6-phosphate isomerase class I